MLITLKFANFYLSNHYYAGYGYVSELKTPNLSTKKGTAIDSYRFSVPIAALDRLYQAPAYLCYNTPLKVYLDKIGYNGGKLIIDGYISKITVTAKNIAEFTVSSIASWQMKQSLAPAVSGSCQNHIYSENCGLDQEQHKYSFSYVSIDAMTGAISLSIDKVAGTIVLGNSTYSSGSSAFLTLANWRNGHILINNYYPARIVDVTEDKIFLNINFVNKVIQVYNVQVFMHCDKTYGICYTTFNNTKNFWGFPNTGNNLQTFDIFSASDLTFCGDDLQQQELEPCDTDDNLFGVKFR